MAVVSVNILHNGWSASEEVGKQTTFTVVYMVQVDDKNDGAAIVMDADDGTTRIPRRFETYDVGNESDPFAFVKSKSPTPIDDKLWHVSVTFGPNEPAKGVAPDGEPKRGLDKDGKPTDDPVLESIDVSTTIENVTRVAERGAYIGQIDLPAGNNNVNDQGFFSAEGFKPGKPEPVLSAKGDQNGKIWNGVPITNSVFTPFDPPPEIDYCRQRITVGMNIDIYPVDVWESVNCVNDAGVVLTDNIHPINGGFRQFFPQYSLRVMGANTARRIKNGKEYWRFEIEFLADYLFGWRLDLLDRGYCVDSNTTSEGAPAKNNITDEKGNQIAEPVLLDGNGNILDLETQSASYLRYAVYPEVSFPVFRLANFDALKRLYTIGLR